MSDAFSKVRGRRVIVRCEESQTQHKSHLKKDIVLSKKKFSNGLDSLFGGPAAGGTDVIDASAVFLGKPRNAPKLVSAALTADTAAGIAPSPPVRRSSALKNFASDLESLLQDAFQESLDEQLRNKPVQQQNESMLIKKPVLRKPISGLDFIIRETISGTHLEMHEGLQKRITLAFDHEKLEKLKSIARIEKAFLKDIVSQLVAEYIENYEQLKGQVN